MLSSYLLISATNGFENNSSSSSFYLPGTWIASGTGSGTSSVWKHKKFWCINSEKNLKSCLNMDYNSVLKVVPLTLSWIYISVTLITLTVQEGQGDLPIKDILRISSLFSTFDELEIACWWRLPSNVCPSQSFVKFAADVWSAAYSRVLKLKTSNIGFKLLTYICILAVGSDTQPNPTDPFLTSVPQIADLQNFLAFACHESSPPFCHSFACTCNISLR